MQISLSNVFHPIVMVGFVKFSWEVFVHVELDISVTIKSSLIASTALTKYNTKSIADLKIHWRLPHLTWANLRIDKHKTSPTSDHIF